MNYSPDKPHSAAETRKALRDVFTDAELFKLSDALLAAISNNVKASACITSREAREAITKEIDLLSALNSKLCAAMDEDEEDIE